MWRGGPQPQVSSWDGTILCGTSPSQKCWAGWSPPLPALKQACAIAKGLFDALKVVPLPALPRPLFLGGRDAAAFHAQLSLSVLVKEGQRDGGKVPCVGKAEGRVGGPDPGFPWRFMTGQERGHSGDINKQTCLLTLWPRFKPPLHHNMFLRDLKQSKSSVYSRLQHTQSWLGLAICLCTVYHL